MPGGLKMSDKDEIAKKIHEAQEEEHHLDKEEMIEKIEEAHKRHVDDFEFVDHEGVKTEVHIKKIDQKGCFKDFFWG